MKNLLFIITIITITSLSVSCKSSAASLQRATAGNIENTISSEVQVTNIKRTASSVTWDAKKGNDCYKCEADDMLRNTNCKKVSCK